MKTRWKILIAVGIMFALVILISVIHHYQLRFAVEKYISELKAKGEPLELAQVIPPPVPPEQNSADILRKADEAFNEEFAADKSLLETNYVYGMKMVAPGKAMVRWQQPDIRDIDGTNSWENIAAAVNQNTKAFILLQQIIQKPNFDFQIKYERGFAAFDFTNLFLIESKRAAQRLEADALCDLHSGDTASAVKNLRAILALTQALRDERFEISELVRIAISSFAFSVNWELLQSPNLTDEQLAALQKDWSGLDFVRSFENAMEMECVSDLITADQWREASYKLRNNLESWTDWGISNEEETVFSRIGISTKVFLWQNWWSYPDESRMLEGYQILLETTRTAQTNNALMAVFNEQRKELENSGVNKFGDWTDAWAEFIDHDFDLHRMFSGGMMGVAHGFHKVITAETAKQIIITAIALKRYQLKHGNYPPDLNSLVPEFVSAIPLDAVDGKPLRYKLNSDGTFLLYSVGENGVDDGGNPSLEKGIESSNFNWQNPRALDWVWPQPATEAEIQKYYEEQLEQSKRLKPFSPILL